MDTFEAMLTQQPYVPQHVTRAKSTPARSAIVREHLAGINLEAELAAIVATVKPLDLEQALEMVKAAGYQVSKPKAKAVKKPLGLNAVGKPYGVQYDPNYRMKYRSQRYASKAGESSNVGPGISPEKWALMCRAASNAWVDFMKE